MAKKLSKELYEELDSRYGTLTEISDDVQKKLDAKYQPSIPISETAPETPAEDSLWVDKKNLRLKLWDGEQWQTVGYEPEPTDPEPTEPTTPTEPENPDIEDNEESDTEGGGSA